VTITVDLQVAYEGQVPEQALFQKWAEAALQEDITEDCELSIRLVEIEESAALNKTYRDKTGPTNVLSFPFDSPIPMEPKLLGDLVICVPIVEKEALEQAKQLDHHWAHLVVHGCLHLLGYDHIEDDQAEEMEAFEVEILQRLAIDNPYLDLGETA
jgi:probable rRNA maturation factor